MYQLWPGQAQFMTILTVDLQVWPWPSTYLNKNNCADSFWNPCINVEVMAQTNTIFDHFIIWPLSMPLTFNVPEQMFKKEQLCQIILKSMHKCTTYGPDKLNLWPFYHLTIKGDLDLQSTWTNVSSGNFTLQGHQLCQIILKSMHKCTSNGLDEAGQMHVQCMLAPKPNWICNNHFIIWPSSVTLTSKLPEQMFRMALLLPWENKFAKLFWNPCIKL